MTVFNPSIDGIRRGNRLVAWLCARGLHPVREPGFLGRSWCRECGEYSYTIEVSR